MWRAVNAVDRDATCRGASASHAVHLPGDVNGIRAPRNDLRELFLAIGAQGNRRWRHTNHRVLVGISIRQAAACGQNRKNSDAQQKQGQASHVDPQYSAGSFKLARDFPAGGRTFSRVAKRAPLCHRTGGPGSNICVTCRWGKRNNLWSFFDCRSCMKKMIWNSSRDA